MAATAVSTSRTKSSLKAIASRGSARGFTTTASSQTKSTATEPQSYNLDVSQIKPLPAAKRPKRPGYKAVYEKHILSTGRWRVGDEFWNVTDKTINDIYLSFQKQRSRGVDCYLTWDHSTSGKDDCGRILSLRKSGGHLYAMIGTNDDTVIAKLESEPSSRVSIMATRGWKDGKGYQYPLALLHVAIVQHPVVSHQKPFVRLLSLLGKSKSANQTSQSTSKSKRVKTRQLSLLSKSKRTRTMGATAIDPKTRKLQAEGEGGGEGGDGGGGTAEPADDAMDVSVKWVVKMLNDLYGAEIPDAVDTAKELKVVLEMLAKGEGMEPEPEPEPEPVVDVIDDMPADTPPELAAAITRANEKIIALSTELAQTRADSARQAKETFVAAVDRLVEDERILPADKESILASGKLASWSLSLLQPFQKRDKLSISTTSKTRRLATNQPDVRGGGDGDDEPSMTKERAKEIAASVKRY